MQGQSLKAKRDLLHLVRLFFQRKSHLPDVFLGAITINAHGGASWIRQPCGLTIRDVHFLNMTNINDAHLPGQTQVIELVVALLIGYSEGVLPIEQVARFAVDLAVDSEETKVNTADEDVNHSGTAEIIAPQVSIVRLNLVAVLI